MVRVFSFLSFRFGSGFSLINNVYQIWFESFHSCLSDLVRHQVLSLMSVRFGSASSLIINTCQMWFGIQSCYTCLSDLVRHQVFHSCLLDLVRVFSFLSVIFDSASSLSFMSFRFGSASSLIIIACQIWFGIQSGWSGQLFANPFSGSAFKLFFTEMPVMLAAIFDR